VRTIGLYFGATFVAAGLLTWALVALGPRGLWFAFVVVWLPMTWLGTVSRVACPRLPDAWHALRPFERDGRLYERVGILIFKRLLRRGPLAVFNPHLHLPAEPDAASIVALDQHMRDAEASHTILFVLTLGVVVNAAVRGWWPASIATLLFDVVLNGYPVMLQRYNRARLAARFAPPAPGGID
jgi:hypothetical protein